MLIGHIGNPWQLQQLKLHQIDVYLIKENKMNTVHKQFEKNHSGQN